MATAPTAAAVVPAERSLFETYAQWSPPADAIVSKRVSNRP
jgi:hypothetical protein